MTYRRKRRELHATLTTLVASACTIVALLAIMAASAFASNVPCPSGGNRAGSISEWETTWPPPRTDGAGVTMCLGEEGIWGTDKGWLQIVDLRAGAKIRLIADREPTGPESSAYEPDTVFRKRTAEDWYTWIRSLNPSLGENWAYTQPRAGKLFSTTNGSFFKDTDNANDTTMPFPRWTWGVADTFGQAQRLSGEEEGAFDWEQPKKYLAVGYHNEFEEPETQAVRVGSFPTRYEWEDLETYIQHVGGDPYNFDTIDATVSFAPTVRIGSSRRRTYLGTYGSVVYLFTSDAEYSNEAALAIMQEIRPGMEVIQLDGGPSAQMYSEWGEMDSEVNIHDQEVADVVAIYTAGEPWGEEEWEQP